MSDRHLEKLNKRLVMASQKKKPVSEWRVEEAKREDETPKRHLKKRPKNIEDMADFTDDEHAFEQIKQDMLWKENQLKKAKKVENIPLALSSQDNAADEDEDEEEDSQQVVEPLDGIELLQSKPTDTLATCFFKDIWEERKKYTFVYLKRKGKCVNIQITGVPWLIQKLSYYYSIRGTDLCKALAALNDGRARIMQAMREQNIDHVDLVKDL